MAQLDRKTALKVARRAVKLHPFEESEPKELLKVYLKLAQEVQFDPCQTQEDIAQFLTVAAQADFILPGMEDSA